MKSILSISQHYIGNFQMRSTLVRIDQQQAIYRRVNHAMLLKISIRMEFYIKSTMDRHAKHGYDDVGAYGAKASTKRI